MSYNISLEDFPVNLLKTFNIINFSSGKKGKVYKDTVIGGFVVLSANGEILYCPEDGWKYPNDRIVSIYTPNKECILKHNASGNNYKLLYEYLPDFPMVIVTVVHNDDCYNREYAFELPSKFNDGNMNDGEFVKNLIGKNVLCETLHGEQKAKITKAQIIFSREQYDYVKKNEYKDATFPLKYITEIIKELEIDWDRVPKDTLVFVSDNEENLTEENSVKRYFCRYDKYNTSEKFKCYVNGMTSETTNNSDGWKYCTLVKEEDIEKYGKR